ncbi:MAG TPA: FHA domain-containing protein [Oculatellaceae cyanobacterium]
MATEQIAKKETDKPDAKKPPAESSITTSATLADHRDATKKEQGRIEQSVSNLSTVEMHKEDGSKVTVNEKSQVTKVVDANHNERDLTYDAAGRIVGIKDQSGSWTTKDGKHWTKEGSQEQREGTASISKDGTLRFKDKDGNETTYQTNGSEITRDAQKRVTRTEDINGQVREFSWGDKGLTQIKDQTGTWQSSDGVNWRSAKGETAMHAATVDQSGALLMRDSNSETAQTLDGKTKTRTTDGTTKITDSTGRLAEVDEANGQKYAFAYGPDGKINKMTEPGGATWSSKDGQHWTSTDGKTRDGAVTLDSSGTLTYRDENKSEVVVQVNGTKETRYANGRVTQELNGKVQETHAAADPNEMLHTAEAIRKATGNDNWVARWADKDAICNLLKDKNEAERKMIDDIYKAKYGVSLDKEMEFMTGADRDKFENILHKKDGDINSQDAGRVHAALLEHQNMFFGRSHQTLDQDIRDSLSTKRADQIQDMDKEYRAKYGVSMRDAIMKDENVSQETKDLVDIYLKGSDKRTDDDTLKLAHVALQAKDPKAFEEVMKEASEGARQKFRDQGGEKQIQEAFGADHGWGTFVLNTVVPGYGIKSALDESQANKDVQHALDLAKEGRIDTVTQINDNKGVINWTTNDKGVEAAIAGMTDQERQRYMLGKKLEAGDESAAKGVDAKEIQESKAYYEKMHAALASAGSETSVDKWEDQIQTKGGSLVSKLASHKGMLWNDSSGDIAHDIENMDKSDWERLHPGSPNYDPNYRKQVEDMLHSYNCDDATFKRCTDILDAKQKAGSFEEAQKTAHSGILDTLSDNQHWYKDDQHGMLQAISNMTPAEQEKYRNDAAFRKQVDDKVKDCFAETSEDGRPEVLQAAQDMLAKVARGEKLNYDIVANLEGHGADFITDHAEAVRDIEKAFKDDPKLRDRINNPQTPEDKAYAAKFESAARNALGDGDYDKYVKPLVTTGHLDIDTKLQLDKGFFKNDHEGAFKDITGASPEELKRLREDPAYREKALAFLNDDDKKIAQNVIDQGKMSPEDQIRQNIVHWGGSSDIMDQLRALKDHPDQLDKAKADYARKYGSDLEGDLISKLGGDDKQEALRILNNHATAAEQYNENRDEYYKSRDGIGSKLVEYVGQSGTGYQLDEAMANYRKEVADANKNFSEITPEKKQELEARFQETLKNFKESKSAAADYVVDGVVAGAAIASLIVTGGADAPLLLAMAAGGAAMKVGAKAAIMGADYDTSGYNIAIDCAEGAVNGVTSVLGPGECAAIFKVGETAAVKAATLTAKELGEQGMKTVLKEGGEELLEKGTAKIMQHALSSGAKEIDQKAIQELAEKSVSQELQGAARERAVSDLSERLSKNLNQEFQKETANWLTNLGRETALNAGGGALGGGTSGAFEGVKEWDPKLSVEQNLARVAQAGALSAASGGLMGGGMTVGMKAIGHSFVAIKSALHSPNALEAGVESLSHAVPVPEHPNIEPRPNVEPRSNVEPHPNAESRVAEPAAHPGDTRAKTGLEEERTPQASAQDLRDEIRPGQSLDHGRTIINLSAVPKEPPLTAGDKVMFKGEKYTMHGTDAQGRYAVISQEGSIPTHRTALTNAEFYSHYTKIEIPNQEGYLVRDGKGQIYRAYSDRSGITIDSTPMKAVRKTELTRPSINGPEDLQFNLKGENLQLEDGKFKVGRNHPVGDTTPNTEVSGDHGEVTWDRNQEKYFYKDTNSTNGSEIRKAGSKEWTPIPKGGKVEFGVGDEIRLAHSDDDILSLKPKVPKEFPDPAEVQIFVGDQPVHLQDDKVAIGRAERVEGQKVITDMSVSSQHGNVRYDAKEGAFYYKDTSSNGTFIKREGSPTFEKLERGKEVRIGAHDEIRLGRTDGPEMKLVRLDESKVVQFKSATDVQVSIDGTPMNLRNGPIEIGRSNPLGDSGNFIQDTRVSRQHGWLQWSNQDKSLVYTDRSKLGTYVKRDGSSEWEFVKERSTKVGPNDEIRLGSTDGPQVKLENTRVQQAQDSQAFFGGKPLDISTGQIEIGRGHQTFGNNQGDVLNKLVSKDHGTLTWNKKEGAFYFTDHSENGTFIKRPDSANFVRIESNKPIKIGPYDQVRLGGEAGPELQLKYAKGEVLDNGYVKFNRPDGTILKAPDGTEIFNDGAGIRTVRGADGKIQSTLESNGLESHISYAADGSPREIKYSSGEVWEKSGNKEWTIRRSDGTVQKYEGDIAIEPDGSRNFKGEEGKPDLVQKLDGSTELRLANGRIEYAGANLETERARLATFSDRNFSNIKQKQRFDSLMNDFQARAKEAHLSDSQVALTYHQINRLMQAGADAPLSLAERVKLSEQIMHEAAYPHLIDQGRNPTCNVATVENRIFTREPDLAAQLITDVATTGKYVTADGTLIDLTRVPGGLRPDSEAGESLGKAFTPGSTDDIKIDGKRNWAGQIFENTAANVKWARTSELHSQPGDVLLYAKKEGKDKNVLMRYSVGADGKLNATEVGTAPKIKTPELTDIHNQITGGHDENFVIVGPGSSSKPPGQALRVNTAGEFEAAMKEAQRKNNFPSILLVDAKNEPFSKWIGTDGNTEAWHVINIQGFHYDARTGEMMVEFTNQWGTKANHLGDNAVPAKQLFEATKPHANTAPENARLAAAEPHPESQAFEHKAPSDGEANDLHAANDNSLDKPLEVAPTPERSEIRPKDVFDPARIQRVSAEISERFRDKPMTSEQFADMFRKMDPQDRKIALELMEHSAGNMNSRALDGQLKDLAQKMDATGSVTIYTTSADTSGNPLAYLFRKNNPNLQVDIKILDEHTLQELADHPESRQALVFDDLSHATPEQKAFLAKQKNLTVADLGGFDKGMNLWDFGATKYAGPELMERKLASLTEEVKTLMGREPQLTLGEAMERVTNNDTKQAIKEINPNAKVIRPEFENDRLLRAEAADTQAEVVQDLYREFTEPMITQKQIAEFLGGIDARQQAAAALVLRDGTTVSHYSTMMEQMRNVQKKILAETGAKPEDLIVVHSFDKNGSAYLVNSLYGKVNGLEPSQFMSLDEVTSAAKGSLKGKVLVYLDDITYSGKQAADNIRENANAFKQTGARVAVGTLGQFEVPADKDYWTMWQRSNDISYQQLKRLNPTRVTDSVYKPFYSPENPSGLIQLFAEDPTLLSETAGTSDWSKSPVDSAVVLPYGGPNNNVDLLNRLLRSAGMPE